MARVRRGGVRLLLVACTLVVAGVGHAAGEGSGRVWLEARNHEVREQRSNLSKVARAAMPSVVSITTLPDSTEPEASGEEPQKGIGSGFIIHPDGYILTSAHVVEGAGNVTISVDSPRGYPETYEARVVGQDLRTDCALLKVEAGRKLPALKLASASRVEVADWIVVIGSPFGLEHSVTVGVVSYKGRTDVTPNGRPGDYDYIQTDASINPGNSGGPVLDLNGDVVAIANAVNVAGQGIGFAVPIDIAKAILPQLKTYGEVRRGWLGFDVRDLSPQVASELGMSPKNHGVVVWAVSEGSPAGRAGLRPGDVIVSMDTERVEKASKLSWQLAARGVGKSVVLQVRRGQQPLKVRVTLEEPPPEAKPATTVAARRPSPRKTSSSRLQPVLTEEDLEDEGPAPSVRPGEPLLGP
ncbi:S1C family serine protease [Hyalangium minutum]|uniref:S1C family serine protease n=1 Tax=Hyalangium minutum TaxID=394096 RepID=UPI0005C4D863|nr:trypsin-like peptidase domain-containing protein [Hyalangium minutum]